MTKKTTRQSDRNLEQFKAELTEGHYNTVVGARRGAAYLPEKDKEVALKLVAKHFGVGVDEPGEATRGARKGKAGGAKKKVSKKPAKKVAKKAAPAAAAPPPKGKKKVAKKLGKQKKAAPAAASEAPQAPTAEAAPAAAPVKKVRAARGSKKAATAKAPTAAPGGVLSDLGIVQNICGTVDTALKTMQLARSLSGDKLDLSDGLREVVETTGAAVASLRKHLPASVDALPKEAPGPMPDPQSNGERPTNMEALTQAAAAAGFPPPAGAPQHVS